MNAAPDPSAPLSHADRRALHAAFVRQAEATPQAMALDSDAGLCTYGQLDAISAALGAALLARGVGRGQTVAVFSDRNAALVYAMLGVSRAGAAFYVADSAYPAKRIAACLEAVDPALMVVCGDVELPGELASAMEGRLLRLPAEIDEARTALADASAEPPRIAVAGTDVAYVAFTSGSTGEPKGIVTTHAPLPHFVHWHATTHDLTPEDRFSLLSGLSHDPVLRDIFTPLSIGACLCIPSQSTIFDPSALVEWFDEHAVTISHLTPAMGEILITGAQERGPLLELRRVFWGGDVLRPNVSVALFEAAPNAAQTNFYGATETPQAMAYFEIDPTAGLESFPIGVGIEGAQILILDESGEVAPPGQVGEICVRSGYLSQGYLGDPEQTKRKFVQRADGSVHYRTGDLGRYELDGNVAFCGRADHQVKIRGFRVELDEVAKRIERQAGIRRAVAVARVSRRDTKVLVAYYTCEARTQVQPAAILDELREVVPNYMVPSFFVRLDEFPLLPNGKLDYEALPEPTSDDAPRAGEYAAARNRRERELVALWQDVLAVDRVGIHDSFTDLGGDSLSAISALIRMRKLGIGDDVARGIFQGKTIAEIVHEEQDAARPGGAAAPVDHTLRGGARTNMLVNVLRGILIAIVVSDHWTYGPIKRLPESIGPLVEKLLAPIFQISTPGFAFVFGIGLGYIYFPKYETNPSAVRRMLRFGVWLLTVSILVRGAFGLWIRAAQDVPITSTMVFNSMYGALLYYLFAILTVVLWFRFIARFKRKLLACAILIVASYALYKLALVLWLDREQTGFLQLARLMAVARFNYFNMSIGALAGVAAGISIKNAKGSAALTRGLLLSGVVLMLSGTVLLRVYLGSFYGFFDEFNMDLWRWLFYCGVVLVVGAGVNAALGLYQDMPPPLRKTFNVVGVMGQCVLPIFVLHKLVLDAKALLVLQGLSDAVALGASLLAFFVVIGWMMRKLYHLHYGTLFAKSA